MSAVKRREFVSDRMPHIIQNWRSCDTIFLTINAPKGAIFDEVMNRLYEELESIFHKFPKYSMKAL
jgi:hypothetical protein